MLQDLKPMSRHGQTVLIGAPGSTQPRNNIALIISDHHVLRCDGVEMTTPSGRKADPSNSRGRPIGEHQGLSVRHEYVVPVHGGHR